MWTLIGNAGRVGVFPYALGHTVGLNRIPACFTFVRSGVPKEVHGIRRWGRGDIIIRTN